MKRRAEWIKGSVYGSFFFIGFGTIWLWSGLADGKPLPVTRSGLLILIALTLFGAGSVVLRRAGRMPTAPFGAEKKKRMNRVFGIVNLLQWLTIFAAAFMLNGLRHPEYIVPAITLIVGLHLFPLARLFGNRLHFVTGTALVVWTIGCCFLLPTYQLSAVVCVGNGIVLLLSAAATLLIGYRACGLPATPAIAT